MGAQLPRRDRHPNQRMAAARRYRLGSPGRRHDQGLRLRRTLLLRSADGPRDSRFGDGQVHAIDATTSIAPRSYPGPERHRARRRPPVREHRSASRWTPASRGSRRTSSRSASRRLFGPTLSRGTQGDLPKPRQRHRGSVRSRLQRSETASTCAIMNPGSDGKFAAAPSTTAPAWTTTTIARNRRLPCTARPRCLRPSASTGASSSWRASPSPQRFWLQASYVYSSLRGQLRRRGQRGLRRPDRPRHQRGLRLPAVPAQRLRAPLPRPAARSPPRRLLHDALRSVGRPRRRACARARRSTSTATSTATTARSFSSCPGAPPDGCRRNGKRTSRSSIRSTIGPVTATLQAYVFNLFNNQIRDLPGHHLDDQPQVGYPDTIYDPNQASSNGNYGLITGRQPPRLFRGGAEGLLLRKLSPEVTVAAGTRLGPYEVLSPLGSGGMGEVWRARDARLSREVAIKVLPAAVASDPERLKRFEKEARSASALNHPTIVTIYDIGATDGVSWIAMETRRGEDAAASCSPTAPFPSKRLLQLVTARGRGPGQGARGRDRAPGPEARERHGHEGRPRQDPGLRPGQAVAPRDRAAARARNCRR